MEHKVKVNAIDLLDMSGVYIELPTQFIGPASVPGAFDRFNYELTHSVNQLLYCQDLYKTNRLDIGILNGNSIQRIHCHKNTEITVLKNTKEVKDLQTTILHNIKTNPIHWSSVFGTKNFRLGSDPEIFCEDEKGIVIPAFNFLSSKADKTTLTAIGNPSYSNAEHGNKPLYWDGFQAEFETSAQHCLGWHVDSVHLGLRGLYEHLMKYNPKGKLSSRTVMYVTQDMLDNAAPEHVAFGCMPSKNAYGLGGLQSEGRDVLFRPAGGHIHFGIGKHSDEYYTQIVKTLDAIIGVACVSLFQSFDNPERRKLYGLAGEYRTPPHGLEYRTLSNAWLTHPLIMNLVFDIARECVHLGMVGALSTVWNATEQETVECIMQSDVKKSQEILVRNKETMFNIFHKCYNINNNLEHKEFIFNIFMNGIQSIIKDPNNLVGNWNLENNGRNWVNHSDGHGKSVSSTTRKVNKDEKVS